MAVADIAVGVAAVGVAEMAEVMEQVKAEAVGTVVVEAAEAAVLATEVVVKVVAAAEVLEAVTGRLLCT